MNYTYRIEMFHNNSWVVFWEGNHEHNALNHWQAASKSVSIKGTYLRFVKNGEVLDSNLSYVMPISSLAGAIGYKVVVGKKDIELVRYWAADCGPDGLETAKKLAEAYCEEYNKGE